MLLLCSVCLGCQDFFTSRHLRSRFYRIPKRYYSEIFGLPGLSHRLKRTSLSGAAKHYEEVFILTLRKIDSFLKDKAEVNWDFLKRFRGRLNVLHFEISLKFRGSEFPDFGPLGDVHVQSGNVHINVS